MRFYYIRMRSTVIFPIIRTLRLAANSAKYGFVSVFLTIVLSFVFFTFGFMAADVVPFSTHYDKAELYKEFVRSAFSDNELRVEIKDGLAECDIIVNTYTNESDKDRYAKNGYNLIVDTRKSDTLIEFSQVAVKGDAEISYEEYLNLTDKEKEGYNIETRYTDKVLEITGDKVVTYESYLEEKINGKVFYVEDFGDKYAVIASFSAGEKTHLPAIYTQIYYVGK